MLYLCTVLRECNLFFQDVKRIVRDITKNVSEMNHLPCLYYTLIFSWQDICWHVMVISGLYCFSWPANDDDDGSITCRQGSSFLLFTRLKCHLRIWRHGSEVWSQIRSLKSGNKSLALCQHWAAHGEIQGEGGGGVYKLQWELTECDWVTLSYTTTLLLGRDLMNFAQRHVVSERRVIRQVFDLLIDVGILTES